MLVEKLKVKSGEVALLDAPREVLTQFKAFRPKTTIGAGSKDRFDFVLLFATQSRELHAAWKKVVPALKQDATFWMAYPKKSSGIESDISSMSLTVHKGSPWQPVSSVAIDATWSAVRFRYAPGLESQRQERLSENVVDADGTVVVDRVNRVVRPPGDLSDLLLRHAESRAHFDRLSFTHRKEYVLWIVEAKKPETRAARVRSAVEKLLTGKRNPAEK